MIYEIRTYRIAPGSLAEVEKRFGEGYEYRKKYSELAGTLPALIKRWEGALPARIKLSPIVLAGNVDFGQANGFIHIWAYSSMDQRMKIRDEARQKGVWPPPGGADRLLTQENKILLPASFSPLQ